MHQKIITGVTAICLLFILFSGCISPQEGSQVPATQTPAVTEPQTTMVTTAPTPSTVPEVTPVQTMPARDGLSALDESPDHASAFNVFFVKSQSEIVNKTNSLLEAMVPGSMTVQAVYSPSMVYVRAEDLGFTTENYYDLVLNMKTTTTEDELNRIAYLQFLNSAKSSAYHIADAAEAESYGDYRTALVMATAAKSDLQNIDMNPDLPPTIPYNLLDVFLNEYIGNLRDKAIADELKEHNSGGSRFPSGS